MSWKVFYKTINSTVRESFQCTPFFFHLFSIDLIRKGE